MKHYIVEHTYVGPDDLKESLIIEVRTAPGTTNMSHEELIEGWLGTTNDWSCRAKGEFDSLEEAVEWLNETWGDYREAEEDLIFEPAVKVFYPGKYPAMTEEETRDYAFAQIDKVHAETTDEEIQEMVEHAEWFANGELQQSVPQLESILLRTRKQCQAWKEEQEGACQLCRKG